MVKVHGVLHRVEEVLAGLTRGLESVTARFRDGERRRDTCSAFFPARRCARGRSTEQLTGVHSLWAPAIVLKMPLVLKPGSAEPWTPFRIIQAFIRAGVPAEVFSYYPHRSRRRQRDPALVWPRHGVW
jgi:hypothetical protein